MPVIDTSLLEQYAATLGFRLGLPAGFQIPPDGGAVFFLRSGPRSFARDLYVIDVATGVERKLLSAADLLAGAEEKLSADEAARRERMRLSARGIVRYDLSADGARILLPLSGKLYIYERKTGATVALASEAGYPIDPQLSPDATKVAAVRDGDLYVTDVASGRERRLTKRESDTISHGLAEFVAQEEMRRLRGYWWSPDSKSIVYQRTDESKVEILRLLDPMHPDRPVREARYPRAGTTNADVRLGVIPAAGGKTVWIEWDRERYPYLVNVIWEQGSPLTVLVQNRTQSELVMLTANPKTGVTRALHTERDAAWVNLDPTVPRWLPSGEFLWTTEREGAWTLELRGADGKLVRALTKPDFGLRGVISVDPVANVVYVSASADPASSHVWRVPLDPAQGAPQALTEGRGMHYALFAQDHSIHIAGHSLLSGEQGGVVRRADGTVIAPLVSVAEEPPVMPNVELTEVKVGERTMHAALIRPTDFDPKRRYPVLVSVYGGPHVSTVLAMRRHYLRDQWFADQGFVVVKIDGRGTPNRGREWERAIRGDFISKPLADQADALAALGERYGELDLSRVGIFGWSFGGYFSAMAVMQRPEVFHVGVAGAPVVEWQDYDTHYTERYLGLPADAPDAYAVSNVLSYADKLSRPLMIIHGTVDDNVYFLHSLKLSDALLRAGKPHAFLPLSGFTHMVPDPKVSSALYTRIVSYFLDQLGPGAAAAR